MAETEIKNVQINGRTYALADEKARKQIDEQNKNLDELDKNFTDHIQWWIDNGYLPDPNNPYKYLYYVGNMNSDLTGGWSQCYTGGGGGTIINNAENIELKTKSTSSNYIAVGTVKPIDLTNYSKIKYRVTGSVGIFYVSTNRGVDPSTQSKVDIVDGWATLDISNLVGNYYVCACERSWNTSETLIIHEVYLMK